MISSLHSRWQVWLSESLPDYMCLKSFLYLCTLMSNHSFRSLPLCPVPFGATGIRAGGAFLTGVPEGPWFCTLAVAARTAASPTTDLPVIRHTGRRPRREDALLSF
uniref:Uncharacterized protein n=1 Tax=Salmo trutta TaxID=8032 RepID=A0A674A0E9_SALTR